MLSVTVAVRDWPTERVEACVSLFAQLPDDLVSEIVVVDFGSAAPLSSSGLPQKARVLRVEAARWSLAEATNIGVLAASNEIIAKTDADILISPGSATGLRAAVLSVATGEFGLLHTQVVDLPETTTLAAATEQLRRGNTPSGRWRPRWGQGGLPIFSRDVWQGIGGYDSRLTGWGGEDNDFTDRVRASGARIGWVAPDTLRLFHLWHPPSYSPTHVSRERNTSRQIVDADRTVLRPIRFLHSGPAVLAAPYIISKPSPMISIALATTSRPGRDRMITEAIRSFDRQIDGDFEVVVVDNGSDDASYEALSRVLSDPKLKAPIRLERQQSSSIPAARNEIARIARGRFICVADDDDLALPNRLADHLKAFEADGLAHGSYGGWIDFDEETGLIEKNTGKPRTIATMLKGTGKVTSHPSSLYRTDVMRALPYDEALRLGSDWDLALRAAALGLRFLHTGSFVTLRRFHTSNVTLTGSSNQVTTGLQSRSRTWALFNPRQQQALTEAAAAGDAYLPCNNDLSLAELLHLLPSYAGIWRLLVPFAALGRPAEGDGTSTVLEKVLELTDGDVTTTESGINAPVLFCTKPIRGARKARRLFDALARLTGLLPQLASDQQLAMDRAKRFDWDSIVVPAGGGMVMSQRLSAVADALALVASLPANSLLHAAANIVSDIDDLGPAYYVIFRPTEMRQDARQMLEELARFGRFRFARSPNLPNIPVEPTDRLH